MGLDLLIKNVRVMRPRSDGAETLDIGIQDGRVARLEAGTAPDAANEVYDGKGRPIYEDGNVVGDAQGQYLSRPSSRPGA